MKYGILGEDKSDAKTIAVLVRRLAKKKVSFHPKGYHGWSELARKAARDLRFLLEEGCQRFIVCVDADGPSPNARKKLVEGIIKKSGISTAACALVAVQEIEAWILADLEQAAQKVILRWKPKSISDPEGISSPKEHLRRLSAHPDTKKARYDEVVHNERMAEYLRLERVRKKCKSFQPLVDFVSS